MTQITTQYDIPRINVQMPGRQNRQISGEFRVVPGITNPFRFFIGSPEGVPLSLVSFQVELIVWDNRAVDKIDLDEQHRPEILLRKRAVVNNPYTSEIAIVLDHNDTNVLMRAGTSTLSWGLIMLNSDNQVFACTVARGGGKAGTLHLDRQSSFPSTELILGTEISGMQNWT